MDFRPRDRAHWPKYITAHDVLLGEIYVTGDEVIHHEPPRRHEFQPIN
jgi:hypothetical protein